MVDRRIGWVACLALMIAIPAASHEASPSDSVARSLKGRPRPTERRRPLPATKTAPVDGRLAHWLDSIKGADSAEVLRLDASPLVSRDSVGFSVPELRREVLRRGLVASVGETTLWRWLSEGAIRP